MKQKKKLKISLSFRIYHNKFFLFIYVEGRIANRFYNVTDKKKVKVNFKEINIDSRWFDNFSFFFTRFFLLFLFLFRSNKIRDTKIKIKIKIETFRAILTQVTV